MSEHMRNIHKDVGNNWAYVKSGSNGKKYSGRSQKYVGKYKGCLAGWPPHPHAERLAQGPGPRPPDGPRATRSRGAAEAYFEIFGTNLVHIWYKCARIPVYFNKGKLFPFNYKN